MKRVIPTVFAHSKKEFDKRFALVIGLSKNVQIDFMDGKFVRGKSLMIKDIPNLKKYKKKFEAHLMIKNPEKYIGELKRKGFQKIIFHYGSLDYHKIRKLIDKIKKLKMKAFIALNPENSPVEILPFLDSADGVLIMGVHPGKEHQKFIPKIYDKIKELKELKKNIKIQIDGGVNFEVARKLKKIGVNYVNSGSFVANAKKPKIAVEKLNEILNK